MDRDAYLLHQVHPAKLATDISADAVSTWLMWRHRPAAALLLAHALAALAAALLVGRDHSRLRTTRRGRYVLTHMPPAAQALRYAGQVLAWYGAYQRRPAGIALGHALVVAGWSFGLVDRHRSRAPAPR